MPNKSKILLQKNSEIEDEYSFGAMDLFLALEGKSLEDQFFIVDHSIDIDELDYDGDTILTVCVVHYPHLVQHILDRGADINKHNKKGRTPLILAIGAARKDSIEVLLKNKADVNTNDFENTSPLMYATKNEPWYFDALLELGADIHQKDSYEQGLLTCACFNNNLYMAKQLLKLGADINEQDSNGTTPLIAAVGQNHKNIINHLLENNPNLDLKNNLNQTVFDVAEKHNLDFFEIYKNFQEYQDLHNNFNQQISKKHKIL